MGVEEGDCCGERENENALLSSQFQNSRLKVLGVGLASCFTVPASRTPGLLDNNTRVLGNRDTLLARHRAKES